MSVCSTGKGIRSLAVAFLGRVRKIMADKSIQMSDVRIVLDGGSSRLLLVQQELRKLVTQLMSAETAAELYIESSPGGNVALGNMYLFEQVLQGISCTTVCADAEQPLGVRCNDNDFHVVIKAGDTTGSAKFFPRHKNQTTVSYQLYQGHNYDAADRNEFVGRLIYGLACKNADNDMRVTMTYQNDGIIK